MQIISGGMENKIKDVLISNIICQEKYKWTCILEKQMDVQTQETFRIPKRQDHKTTFSSKYHSKVIKTERREARDMVQWVYVLVPQTRSEFKSPASEFLKRRGTTANTHIEPQDWG